MQRPGPGAAQRSQASSALLPGPGRLSLRVSRSHAEPGARRAAPAKGGGTGPLLFLKIPSPSFPINRPLCAPASEWEERSPEAQRRSVRGEFLLGNNGRDDSPWGSSPRPCPKRSSAALPSTPGSAPPQSPRARSCPARVLALGPSLCTCPAPRPERPAPHLPHTPLGRPAGTRGARPSRQALGCCHGLSPSPPCLRGIFLREERTNNASLTKGKKFQA